MTQIIFKNLEASELARDAARERVQAMIEKFPDLSNARIRVTLEMKNSPKHPGPDLFAVKFHATGGKYKEVTVEKSSPNLYSALADVVDHLLEVLNRTGDRSRVRALRQARATVDVAET